MSWPELRRRARRDERLYWSLVVLVALAGVACLVSIVLDFARVLG